jgi:hypothetical protein
MYEYTSCIEKASPAKTYPHSGEIGVQIHLREELNRGRHGQWMRLGGTAGLSSLPRPFSERQHQGERWNLVSSISAVPSGDAVFENKSVECFSTQQAARPMLGEKQRWANAASGK